MIVINGMLLLTYAWLQQLTDIGSSVESAREANAGRWLVGSSISSLNISLVIVMYTHTHTHTHIHAYTHTT